METVRAINTSRSSKRTKNFGPHTSTPKGGAGSDLNPSDVIDDSTGEGAVAAASSQAGIPVPGKN